jgi:co-chaperonin GroES (HSP10)
VVLVEMLPPQAGLRGILLPDRVSADLRPDVGVVLACGPDVNLRPGDTVAVRAYDGQWIEGFYVTGALGDRLYETPNQVRCYGHFSPHQGVIERCQWSDSIPVLILPEEEAMVATHNNLIVRREGPVTRERGIELPDSEVYRTGMAVIESIGPKADLAIRGGDAPDAARVGDRVHYDTRGELEFAFGGDPDLAVIPDCAVNFVVRV